MYDGKKHLLPIVKVEWFTIRGVCKWKVILRRLPCTMQVNSTSSYNHPVIVIVIAYMHLKNLQTLKIILFSVRNWCMLDVCALLYV